jgi:hypothetical protein
MGINGGHHVKSAIEIRLYSTDRDGVSRDQITSDTLMNRSRNLAPAPGVWQVADRDFLNPSEFLPQMSAHDARSQSSRRRGAYRHRPPNGMNYNFPKNAGDGIQFWGRTQRFRNIDCLCVMGP